MALSMAERGKLGGKARAAKPDAGATRKRQLSFEEHRNRIKVGMIQAQLHKAAEGKIDLTSTQVKACEVLLNKAIPTLQAVENTFIDQAATRSEAELYADLKALIAAHPDLIQAALAEHAREQGQKLSDAPQQTASIAPAAQGAKD